MRQILITRRVAGPSAASSAVGPYVRSNILACCRVIKPECFATDSSAESARERLVRVEVSA